MKGVRRNAGHEGTSERRSEQRGRALSPENQSRDVIAALVNDAVEEALGFGNGGRLVAGKGGAPSPRRKSRDG